MHLQAECVCESCERLSDPLRDQVFMLAGSIGESCSVRLRRPCYSYRVDGAVVVDKPSGWTSHDVVNKVRRFAGTKKVGHLGTLDPAATGVLPLVIGRATRLAQFYTRNDKVYEGVIHFGYSTDSYDADGQPTSPVRDVVLDRDQVDAALQRFRGAFAQVPPQVSAKKVAGRPAYEMARKNQPVE